MKVKVPENFPQAIGKGVILLPIEEQEKTNSGIIIPTIKTGAQNEQTTPKIGVLMHVGADVTLTVFDSKLNKSRVLKIGDRVMYNPYADAGFLFDNNWYIVMSELDVKAFYADDKAVPMGGVRQSRKRGAVEKRKFFL